jgi:CRISPR-associated protein Cmr4
MKNQMIGLVAETFIHAGAGRSTGVIDLPIMREAHTGWPCVYGSSVKGAIRSLAQSQRMAALFEVFGPDTNNASDHAGALSVGDARILLLPVRSLTSHFKWVTCPALLRRAVNDAKRLGLEADAATLLQFGTLEKNMALTLHPEGTLHLEEFCFTATKNDKLTELVNWLACFTSNALNPKIDQKERLQEQLVVIHDDVFMHIAQYGTPVTPHIAIDNANKIVKGGALWYEETLPPETVLYFPLMASASRKAIDKDTERLTEEAVMNHVLGLFPESKPYLQLGGNETVGMGWCRVNKVQFGG